MVTAKENELSAHDPQWQRYAVQLARLRVAFEVNGLNELLDGPFCRAIRDKFNLEMTFDAKSERFHFVPRN
jgi:hypothetical protein